MINDIEDNQSFDLDKISEYFTPEIVSTFAEVHQPRSAFQIEKFIINAHDTDEMKYVQCITEIQSLYYTIKRVALELKKSQIEIDRLRSTGDPVDEIDAQIKELGIEETRVVGVGAFRELKVLLDIKNSLPSFTRKEIEAAQPEYWKKRLHRQFELEALSGSSSQAGHLMSLSQIGEIDLKQLEFNKEEVKEVEQ